MKLLSKLTRLERDQLCDAAEDHGPRCDCELCLYATVLTAGIPGPFSADQIRSCREEQGMRILPRGLFL